MNETSGARQDVLAFYKELPFNYRRDPASQADELKRQDLTYPQVAGLLKTNPRLLDVGCGPGWLPNNAAYHHGSEASGIDFNPVAIERARQVSQVLGVTTHFEVADVFSYRPANRFPLVTSVGVLHHTNDCRGAIRCIAERMVEPRGRMFIGLYHTYGRRPFLKHFADMKAKGASTDAMYAEFCRLRAAGGQGSSDETFQRSWFRDQVLHPHETQHTLAEMLPLLDDLGFELESTSINRFGPLPDRGELISAEAQLERTGEAALVQGRYFPGFFIFMARRLT